MPNCDASRCPLPPHDEFTVADRPPGLTGLEGWPEGAPELSDENMPTGRVIRFCRRHAHQLREAADRHEAARPFYPRTVDGIRPHKPMTPAEHDLARRYADEAEPNPAAVEELRRWQTS